MEAGVTLPAAIALAIGTSLLTVGTAWGMMRMRVTSHEKGTAEAFARVEKKQDMIDRDLREGFNRIAALERGAVTHEAFADFRKEMSEGFRDLRDLIEKLRPRPTRKPAEE